MASVFGQLVLSAGENQLVLPHLLVEEGSERFNLALDSRGSLAVNHGKHFQHLEDSLQGEGLEVDEHVDDVGPEDLQLFSPLVARRPGHRFRLLVLVAVTVADSRQPTDRTLFHQCIPEINNSLVNRLHSDHELST